MSEGERENNFMFPYDTVHRPKILAILIFRWI
jgi:hypothetical protein